jgi:sugar O-acyltransferase (sialic acid O-acetyltransferase NeuD family)
VVAPERVLIVGAGGHGQVVADALLRAAEAGAQTIPVGYVDDNPALAGEQRLGLPIYGPVAAIGQVAHDSLVLAIGDNWVRRRLYRKLREQGERFALVQHPRSVVAPDAVVGAGSVICAGVVVNPGSRVGSNVILNTGCTVDHHNTIGDHAHVAPGVHLGGDVQLGEGVLVGIGATVMPQRSVGEWSIVGAGALVTRDVQSYVVVAGSPARSSNRGTGFLF